MRLPWKCHNQSQDTNWRHCVTGPELPFFHKRKGVLKIDQSVKLPWYRLSIGVASSCSSAPDSGNYEIMIIITSICQGVLRQMLCVDSVWRHRPLVLKSRNFQAYGETTVLWFKKTKERKTGWNYLFSTQEQGKPMIPSSTNFIFSSSRLSWESVYQNKSSSYSHSRGLA